MKKILALVLALVLALSLCACGAPAADGAGDEGTPAVTDGATLGEGATTFALVIKQLDGSSISATINTDAETVGEALEALGVLKGEEGPYGIYIKEVNGVTAVYEEDGTYWAFYIDGEYAMTGADVTPVTAGAEYTFAVEKG